jgi:hypothetical protein|tara:strand:- start:3080 stop:3844 length:765 start_codon:yes stop_codon:yes gene_type:complete
MDIDSFIKDCKVHSHYQHIKRKPKEFDNWRNDKSLLWKYSKWIETESNTPTLKMNIEVPNLQEMVKEANNIIVDSVKHRGDVHPGWESITLHGQSPTHTQPKNYYIEQGEFTKENAPPYDWTSIAEQCPATVDWLKTNWHYHSFDRVRFMLLKPGGYIKPHQDYKKRQLAAYNFAITNPPGIEFAMEDAGLVPWQPGDVRAIDIGRLHAVKNTSNENRIHMIVHGNADDKHWQLLCESFDILMEELDADNSMEL